MPPPLLEQETRQLLPAGGQYQTTRWCAAVGYQDDNGNVFLTWSDAIPMNPAVILTFGMVIALETAIPLLLGYLIVKRFALPWRIFLFGALFFIFSQVIHIPLLLLLQQPYTEWVMGISSSPIIILAAIAIFLGLFSGILEEGIRFLAFSRFFPARSLPLNRKSALLFGAGWGGIECIIVAVLVFFSLVSYVLVTSGALDILLANVTHLSAEQAAELDMVLNLTPLDILPGLVERMMVLVLHISFTFLVLLSVLKSRKIFLLAAIAWHAGLNSAVVFLAQTQGIWPVEAFIVANALAGVLAIRAVWNATRDGENGSIIPAGPEVP